MDKYEFRKVRKELGLTQEEMGAALGVSRHTILRHEQSDEDIPRLVELACERLSEIADPSSSEAYEMGVRHGLSDI